MLRKLRVAYPGAVCHLMSRGDRRNDVFLDGVDRQNFERRLEARPLEAADEAGLSCLRLWTFPN